jgi:hypothetical protein
MGELPQGYAPPAVGTRLITKADDLREFTATQETDARTALTRGLAEYVSGLEWLESGGRYFKFERVFSSWAEPEDEALYPSAVVRADGQGEYLDSKLTPAVQGNRKLALPDGRYVVSSCEYMLDIVLEARTTDPEARAAITAMLERELSPVDWRYGLLLELPHYFNQRASFEPRGSTYLDAEDKSLQRLRIVTFALRACVPLTRLSTFPLAKIKTSVEVSPEAGVIKGVASKRNW